MMPDKTISKIKIRLFYTAAALIPVFALSLAYFVYAAYRSKSLYDYVKSNQRGWTGHVHGAHKDLGFASVGNSSGSETMPIGPDIPMRYDKDGFRITIEEEQDTKNRHPVLLTLGGSFTYGAATLAKDTFPYLVGKYLGGSTKNAGVGSYGLSQMVILAKRLIPYHQPDYVIVQYSTWLVNRAVSVFAPAYFGKLPSPYYSGDENLEIRPPIFQAKMMEFQMDKYRSSQEGLGDFLSFLWNVGLPLFLHDDFNMSVYTLAGIFKLNEPPTTNHRAVIQHAYGEINSVAEKNGAMLIIVVLGNNIHPVPVQRDLLPKNVKVVDAHQAMLERLPVRDTKSYRKHYYHWRGNPPRIVDAHPNEKAHMIIAETIISQISEIEKNTN